MGKNTKYSIISYFTPFIYWIPELKNSATLRADIIAGITVALVLIPQSMAYASLAGLPPYYGLYAAFMPPIVAAIFGSSRQLATGPVAVVSLMTAAALEPIATAGSEAFIAYAILLAILVGLFQITLGLLRLGVLVNFLAHPVVVGFTNAAAIIIATSQLGKIFGVSVEKMPHHYETVWNTFLAAAEHIHWPTFSIAVLAFAIMIILRKISPRIPGVLVAVVITTLLAWAIDFQKLKSVSMGQIRSEHALSMIDHYHEWQKDIESLSETIIIADKELVRINAQHDADDLVALQQKQITDTLRLERKQKAIIRKKTFNELTEIKFRFVPEVENQPGGFYPATDIAESINASEEQWHISNLEDAGTITFRAGGTVVGDIPQGLPSFKVPKFDFDIILQLFSVAITIALIGFMEAISIAKAMAARTRQRLDANQELVGQGLGNIVGGLFQSYPSSGSFSRSAVNIGAGAVTGFSSIVTGLVVVITLLWFTPLLYNLPQATLAAVIMMAVIGLVNIKSIKHAWKASRHDGAVAVITFALTLVFAPHLDKGIMLGVGLSLVLYLYRTMAPRVIFLSRYTDGTLRNSKTFELQQCENISMLRFEGSLYFANTSYFENMVQKALSQFPKLKFVIVDGVSINQIDATGEEMLRELVVRLREEKIEVLFYRFKKPIIDMLKKTGFAEMVGEDNFFRKADDALEYAWSKLSKNHKNTCPIHKAMPVENQS